MKIYVVGSGKLANALLKGDQDFFSGKPEKWPPTNPESKEKAIVMHAGSGRQLEECFKFCSRTKSILIELGTGSESEKYSPDFPLILCPNASILMLKTLQMIRCHGNSFKDYEISILESHQASKKSQPGTALAIADAFSISYDTIQSIRDSNVQKSVLNIPGDAIHQHAYHQIKIRNKTDELTIETKVLGLESYVNGLKEILKMPVLLDLQNKLYYINDLI